MNEEESISLDEPETSKASKNIDNPGIAIKY